jgi:hypothetical protein
MPPHEPEQGDLPSAESNAAPKNTSGPEDRQAYANQFRWRFNTAIHHIRQAFLDNSQQGNQ